MLQSYDAKFVKKLHGEFHEANVMAGFRRGVNAIFSFSSINEAGTNMSGPSAPGCRTNKRPRFSVLGLPGFSAALENRTDQSPRNETYTVAQSASVSKISATP
jgi:hypothetical protein